MADVLAPGTLLIGRYRILHLAGTGGMGAVYKAADTHLGDRIVALKELSQSGLNPQELAEATEAFKREALLLAGLHHPGLPSIHDHFTAAGHWYLVMDIVEGETLEDYLQHAGRPGLPVSEVLRIADQLCAVLGYLHQHAPPVIFRDLKPSNVMVNAAGQPTSQLRLIDFGIARFFKSGQAHDTVSFGSPGYAPPEQYGRSQTTVRSDIFSFGALLHHLLTGRDPSIKPFSFPPIQPLNAQTPPELEALVLQMVELDESQRPPSVAGVRQELDQIARHASTMQTVQAAVPPPQHAPLIVQMPPAYPPPWSPQPMSPPLSRPGGRRHARTSVPTYAIVGAALAAVCVVAVICCASSLGQSIAAIQSASGTAAVQQAAAQATATVQAALDQAVANADDQLSTDLSSLDSDVTDLPTTTVFNHTLNGYATDWAQMQKDYQKEQRDFQQGCGEYGYNASVVSYDASNVNYDLSSIQYDDSSLSYDESSVNSPLQQAQADLQTTQSDWQTLQTAMTADPTATVSAQASANSVNAALAQAQQQVSAVTGALQSAQTQAKQYDQEATQTNTAAQTLATSMHC